MILLTEREKKMRFELAFANQTIKRMSREIKLLKDKVEFLEYGKKTHTSWSRGSWIWKLKKYRKNAKVKK